ncbi:MAG TPA: outer membrane lipoprotein carrier protein LolA [Silvibacterium sp.]|nr:outer membrane lipoprotein carrier protein LolA [Silvibacterium sp.]
MSHPFGKLRAGSGRSSIVAGVRGHNFLDFVLVLSLCALYSASSALAQQTAQSLAAQVDRHYNALHSLRVNFVQEYAGLGQQRRESGVLLLKKPGRMKWTYSQPPGKLFVLDSRNAYFYSPGQSEIQRVAAKKLDDLRSPLRFLLGHAELAKELTGMQITSQGENYELSGTPKDMEPRVAALRFTVSAEGVILGIKVEEVDGSVSTFTFTDEVPNPPASNADFVFHAPAGTVVINGLPPD